MSQPVLLKVYGNFCPANNLLFEHLAKACAKAVSMEQPVVFLEGDLLRISFEGIYFPVDEVLKVFQDFSTPDMQGKLDYLDLENWTMSRYIFKNGKISSGSVSLNNVLDYSGF